MAPTAPKKTKKPRIPGYKLLKRLGAGGQASVYLGIQISMGRHVAIKIIPPNVDLKAPHIARFLREARVLARLRHENIVGAIDYGEIERLRYFVMEFIEGDAVLDLIESSGAFEARRCLEIALQICRAAGYLAEHGIVHRDVKPGNIVITDESRAVLVDFGLARREVGDGMVTAVGSSIGTPSYMSPEQIRGLEELDVRADLYGLGATMYHMLVGRVPFQAASRAEILASHLKDVLELPTDLPRGVPEDIFGIIKRSMAKSRNERYQTADAMAADLLAAIERRADAGKSETGGESLELLEEVAEPERAAEPSLKHRVLRLSADRDRLARENAQLVAGTEGVKKKARELIREGKAELERVRGAEQAATERIATLELELKAAAGRVAGVEDAMARREEARQEALRRVEEISTERAELAERVRDAEGEAARMAAASSAARKSAEARAAELATRLAELESDLARRDESLAAKARETERFASERDERTRRAKEARAELEDRNDRLQHELDGLAEERNELREQVERAREDRKGHDARSRRAIEAVERERERAAAERDALRTRVEELESLASAAASEATRLQAEHDVEAESAARDLARLRERVDDLTRRHASAESRAREAEADLESVSALAREDERLEEVRSDLRAEVARTTELATRLQIVEEERTTAEERAADASRRAAVAAEEIAALGAERDALGERFARLDESAGRNEEEAVRTIEKLRDRVDQAERALAEVEEPSRSHSDGEEARADAEEARREARDLGARLEAAVEALARAEHEASRARDETEENARAAATERQALERGLAAREAELEELRSGLDEGADELRQRLEDLLEQRETLARELEQSRAESARRAEREREAVEELRGARDGVTVDRDRAKGQAAALRDALRSARDDAAAETERHESELARLSGERDELKALSSSLEGRVGELERLQRDQARAHAEATERAAVARAEIERRLQAREQTLEEQEADALAAEHAHDEALEALREQRDGTLAARAELAERVEDLESQLARVAAKRRIDAEQEPGRAATAEIERDRLRERVEQLEAASAGTEALRRERDELEARIQSIEKKRLEERRHEPGPETKESDMAYEGSSMPVDEAERVAAYTLRRVEELKRELRALERARRSEREKAQADLERLTGELERANADRRQLAVDKAEAESRRDQAKRALADATDERDELRAALTRTKAGRSEERGRAAARLRRLRNRIRVLEMTNALLRSENEAFAADRGEINALLSGPAMHTQELESVESDPHPEQPTPDHPASVEPRDMERMVLIPRGTFIAGEDEGDDVDSPRREVETDGFWIDLFPVTNVQYAKFIEETRSVIPPDHWDGGSIPAGLDDHPVVCITWQDAAAYAAWQGKRLPTPVEWQKAARGTDGRAFPWGEEEEVARCNCRESGLLRTTRVGQYRTGRSPYGLSDIAGNVAEWVHVRFAREGTNFRVVCGGSWRDTLLRSRCAARRGYPDGGSAAHVGFRCAMSRPSASVE